ncbi:hypothetical protein GCM10017600_74560 [Streptosporangium carneum]|uniref:Uncharacterized protein n=1 Tax=Streptosporangium carneum TaxID=47481 RepID=A0A9W6IAK8_9ACTN|nr:hypothetical protein GCM10017600_74560 [Streptosporangium carneum]
MLTMIFTDSPGWTLSRSGYPLIPRVSNASWGVLGSTGSGGGSTFGVWGAVAAAPTPVDSGPDPPITATNAVISRAVPVRLRAITRSPLCRPWTLATRGTTCRRTGAATVRSLCRRDRTTRASVASEDVRCLSLL